MALPSHFQIEGHNKLNCEHVIYITPIKRISMIICLKNFDFFLYTMFFERYIIKYKQENNVEIKVPTVTPINP